jgi:hypothetical protein
MKVTITALTPSYAERVDQHINDVIQNHESLVNLKIDNVSHELLCEACYVQCLTKMWQTGKQDTILKDIPEWLHTVEATICTYEGTLIEREVHIAYKGEIIELNQIPHILRADITEEPHDCDDFTEKKERLNVQEFESLEEVLNYIFKKARRR